MSSTSSIRLVVIGVVVLAFLFGFLNVPGFSAANAYYPTLLTGFGSALAWALSATISNCEQSAGPNLAAALFAAMSVGFGFPLSLFYSG